MAAAMPAATLAYPNTRHPTRDLPPPPLYQSEYEQARERANDGDRHARQRRDMPAAAFEPYQHAADEVEALCVSLLAGAEEIETGSS
jgi:hypothetical protein